MTSSSRYSPSTYFCSYEQAAKFNTRAYKLPYSETDMTIVLDKGLRRPHWRTRSRPLRNLTLPIFDYQPRPAYTHENGFAFTISRVFRPAHQLGRDADACRSQHRHCVYVRFFCSNDH